jgi:hypothetical protein
MKFMADKKNQPNITFRRDPASGYGDGHRIIPAAGEDRDESVYRNPVGAQSGYELEGQRKGPAELQREPGAIKRGN